jgi:hypothetical protein
MPLREPGQTEKQCSHICYSGHIFCIVASCSGYSNHILNAGYAYGTITDTMDIIKTARKRKHLNTLEKYYIYKLSKNKQNMNDTHVDTHNPIFEILQELNTG